MKYIKPAFKEIRIEFQNLCAGSSCATIEIKVQKLKKSNSKTYTFKEGETKGMWNKNF